MAFMAMKKNLGDRARKKGIDSIFNKFDHNHNGKVFIRDFISELEALDLDVSEDEIKTLQRVADQEGQISRSSFETYCKESRLIRSLDKNKDGVISATEFTSKQELAFNALDQNHDGFISRAEFAKLAKTLTKEQVTAVLSKFDEDGDGKLDYGEFRNLLQRNKK